MKGTIYMAPPGTGTPILNRTLTSVFYEACERYPNPKALNQPRAEGWEAYSSEQFRTSAEEIALGLVDLGLERGDRVALFMESDVYFCFVDMGCLIAGLIDVPIYITHAPEAIEYVINHSEAKVLVVSHIEDLHRLSGVLPTLRNLRTVIVAEMDTRQILPDLPGRIQLLSLDELRERGRQHRREEKSTTESLLEQVDAQDLATIIYTSGTTGRPKGVMLTHENISYNALTSFTGLSDYRNGPDGEVTISFLPYTHIFARALHYGFVSRGTSIYFTTPDNLSRDLVRVRPTIFATVPRVLEKVYARIRERAATLKGVRKVLLKWALRLAEQYRIGEEHSTVYHMKVRIVDALVYKKWRAALGGRVRYIISGGAALTEQLTNLYAAARITILQGYGLTETSPVIAFNRPGRNIPGTVGEPLPGLEVMLTDDGEILTRGPHVMRGYFKDEELTRSVIDPDGWFHTGDIGEISPEGYLRITDRKKDLFKLSTGKYVIPQTLESRLVMEPLVEQAVVVGPGYKFCAALIFPDQDVLRVFARSQDIDPTLPVEELIQHPVVIARYQALVDKANEGLDHWSTIKRFQLVPDHITVESGLLTPTMKLKRTELRKHYENRIQSLYDMAEKESGSLTTRVPTPKIRAS